jgi:ribosomal protein S20
MPHHKTAKRSRDRNIAVKSEIKTSLKKAQETPANKDVVRLTVSKLDRAVRKGVIPKAVANRRKSRLARMVNRATPKAS